MNEGSPDLPGVGGAFLAEARRRLGECRARIAHCLGQLNDGQVWWRPRESMNSVGNLVLHLCGNLRQWLVSGVGGAPDVRDRAREFEERTPIPRDDLLLRFFAVTEVADAALAAVDESRLLEPRRIQGFDGTVLSAVFGSLVHLSGHTQEIVYISRIQLGDAYRFAWAPTTAEEGAAAADRSGVETVEVRDAVFEQGSLAAMRPPDLADEPRQSQETPSSESGSPDSPLQDYLLELEQEFQDQNEEGKL